MDFSDIEYDTPILFNRSDKIIKRIIKERSPTYTNEYLDTFHYGFIILCRKDCSNIGSLFIKGFIMFILTEYETCIESKILYGSKNYPGTDLVLFNKTLDFAMNRGIIRWSIFSLPYDHLIAYYEFFGFVTDLPVMRNGKIKVIKMSMELT